jgi:hypothetical protein
MNATFLYIRCRVRFVVMIVRPKRPGRKVTVAPQMPEFIQRQLTALAGLTDALSVEIRQSWEALAAELATAPVPAVELAQVVRFAPREPQSAIVPVSTAA